jgi:arylsulfatase A-like enzyme
VTGNQPTEPNIVVIVLDTLSAWAAGLGRSPAAMPFLERLAERGRLFEHAVANAPWTYPSHASILTGLLPSEHGMNTRNQFLVWEQESGFSQISRIAAGRGPKSTPSLGERWLPALLAHAGYETVLASNNPWVGRLTQMDHGFRWVRDTTSVRLPARQSLFKGQPKLRSVARCAHYAERALRGRGDLLGEKIVQRLEEWSGRRDADRPFFLFVNLIEAHAPYVTPHAAGAAGHVGVGPTAAFRGMMLLEPRRSIRYNLAGDATDGLSRVVAYLRELHRRSAGYLDGLVEAIRDVAARQAGGLLMCVTSDHGESFGDHGFIAHGFSMFEPGLHVPLVLSGDGVPEGTSSDTVDIRRIYSTLLATAGIEAPPDAAPSLLDRAGGDVVAEREGVELPAWAAELGRIRPDRAGRLQALYRNGWKVIQTEQGRRLFDLLSDPGETSDLAHAHAERAAELAAALPAWAAHEEGSAADDPAGPALSAGDEAQIASQLAALGYLE